MTRICARRHLVMVALLVSLALPSLAAGPAYWDSPGRIAFADGEFQGAGLDAGGRLVPGLAAETVLADSSLVLWSGAVGPDGSLVVGSGHEGRVWRIDKRGKASLLADLPAEEVFSVLVDGDQVLAGCGPGGQIFRIGNDGEVTELGTVPGGYAWDLERAVDGTIYVATGSPAGVYRLTDEGPEAVVEMPASNALDLAVEDDGTLLVATQGPGRVFHVLPDRKRWALIMAMEQDEGRQIVRGPDGWYALGYQANGSGNGNGGGGGGMDDLDLGPFDIMVTPDADIQPVRSALYRLDGEVPARVWSSELTLTSVAWSDDHGWVGAGARKQGSPSRLFALATPNDRRPLADWDGGDVLSLLVATDDSDPDVLVALQAHPGRVTRLVTPDKDGAVAVSPPLDGRVPVRWGRLTWRGAAGGSEPRFAVRTGMSTEPDASWTPWVDLGRGHDLDLKDIPATRCLQWRATLPRGSRVDAVTVSGFEPNLPPGITHFELQPDGQMYQGSMMQGPENATQRFDNGMQVEYNTQSLDDRRLDRDRAASLRPLRALTWHATDPNEDRLVYQLFQRREGESLWLPVGEPTRDQVRTWDTNALDDGWYELRLLASDHTDNPGDQARTDERTLPAAPVDNTAPEIDDWRLEHHRDGFRVSFEARDRFGPLAGAEVQLPDGVWQRLDPEDLVCDSAEEAFTATVRYPLAWAPAVVRPWTVRVRVWDLQGNVAHAAGTLP